MSGNSFRHAAAAAATAGLLVLAVAACHGGGSSSAAKTGSQPSYTPAPLAARLAVVADPGGLPAQARSVSAFAVPQPWSVDGFGVRADGDYLAFKATDLSAPMEAHGTDGEKHSEIWIVDTRTGQLYRSAKVDQGMAIASLYAGGGWVLRVESAPVVDGGCADPADCWTWRLYAQRLPDGRPTLLEQPPRPMRQALVPYVTSDGKAFAWQQGLDDTHGVTMVWHPGDAHATRLDTTADEALVTVDGDHLFEEVHQTGADGGAGPSTVYRENLDGGSRTQIAKVTSSCCAAIRGSALAYFGAGRDQAAGLDVLRIAADGSISTTPLEPFAGKTAGFYYASWIDADRLLIASNDGTQVVDLADRSAFTFPTGAAGQATVAGHTVRADAGRVEAVVTSGSSMRETVVEFGF